MQDLPSYDNQVFTFDDGTFSVPNNSPNHEFSVASSPVRCQRKNRGKRKFRRHFQPCCCGGKLETWAYVVAAYEFIIWLGMAGMKVAFLLFTNELGDMKEISRNELTDQSVNVIDQVEIMVFGYGALCGVLMLVCAISRTGILCLVHMGMSSILVLALLVLIIFNITLNERHYKWNLILAYFGFLILQSYISVYSFGLRQLFHEQTGATSSTAKIPHSRTINRPFRPRHIVPKIVITDYD
ncbi:unnamed protein product [Allacma fusca]|uniref:Uncharacterized protein n=1 Tax=Allacma fusca TaxID=39272 RepID=A0A8J2K8D5_9HEXA|nr:unnamed protein product [Allacma fusca]